MVLTGRDDRPVGRILLHHLRFEVLDRAFELIVGKESFLVPAGSGMMRAGVGGAKTNVDVFGVVGDKRLG